MSAEDNMLLSDLIDKYTDLQRILSASDMKKEAEYQLRVVKAKLAVFDVVIEDLDIH